MITGKIKLTLAKTADGKQEYLQIISDDQVSLNIVLIADKFKIHDIRGED